MTATRRSTLSLAAGIMAVLAGMPALAADSTITVSLWDRGPGSAMMDDARKFMMSKSMMPVMGMAMMGITLDKTEVPAGMVTFNVTNESKDIIHEMVISPIVSLDVELPYIADENRIDEDAAGHLGEVAELDPGKAGILGMEMKPGQYLLYCNIPGHYIGGMWTVLTVTP